MTAAHLVRVEADVRIRKRLDGLADALSGDDRVQLLGAGYEAHDAPLAVGLLCAGTEEDARTSAEAAVADALRSLGVDAAPSAVEVGTEPEREAGPSWLVLVEIEAALARDTDDRLLDELHADRRIAGGSTSVARGETTSTVFFAVDCPRERVDATAVSVVADALRRVGVQPATARVALVFHPDGGPA
jgi:hypothetical protein